MEEKLKTKKKFSTKQIVNIVVDAVLFPILLFAGFFSISLVITRATRGVPSVFGYAMIKIISGSMQDAGFKIGDTAFIKSKNVKDYQVGDYIAFYDYVDPNCPTPPMVANGQKPTNSPKKGRIVFHQIVSIETDANGNLWFHTKGTNNPAEDKNIIFQDYVIGSHVEGGFVPGVMSFVSSPLGILILIVLPCTIILFRDCYELISLTFFYFDQKKKLKKPLLKSKKKYIKFLGKSPNKFFALNNTEKQAKIEEKTSKKKKFLKFKLKKENLPNKNEIEIK